MTIVYGIKNCSTVQKALKSLDDKNIKYTFWDYKKQGIDKEHLSLWCNKFGWEKVLNRAGQMWAKANEEEKLKVVDKESAIEFMLKTPTSIKRPIIETGKDLTLGFKAESKDPLHGITLQAILEYLFQKYGWETLAQKINIKCFSSNPSVKSSLTFLRKTPWAREKVENLYIISIK